MEGLELFDNKMFKPLDRSSSQERIYIYMSTERCQFPEVAGGIQVS